jgi:hypothetical protein
MLKQHPWKHRTFETGLLKRGDQSFVLVCSRRSPCVVVEATGMWFLILQLTRKRYRLSTAGLTLELWLRCQLIAMGSAVSAI